MAFNHLNLPCLSNRHHRFSIGVVQRIRQRRLERTIQRTFAIWRQRFPRWANSGFDEYFLLHDALPLLSDMLSGVRRPDPVQFARHWVMAYGISAAHFQRAVTDVTPVAEDFLSLLKSGISGSSRN